MFPLTPDQHHWLDVATEETDEHHNQRCFVHTLHNAIQIVSSNFSHSISSKLYITNNTALFSILHLTLVTHSNDTNIIIIVKIYSAPNAANNKIGDA